MMKETAQETTAAMATLVEHKAGILPEEDIHGSISLWDRAQMLLPEFIFHDVY